MNLLTKVKDFYSYFFSKRKTIPQYKIAVNGFFNKPLFQTNNIDSQCKDISNILGISLVRILFYWSDNIQPNKNSPINFSFWDEILQNLPKNCQALIVINGAPAWVEKDSVFNKRGDFVHCVETIIDRYKNNPKVVGWQIGNEINTKMFHDNEVYGFVNMPIFYLEVLGQIYSYAKKTAPTKLVVGSATTSIIQNFPHTLNYNRKLLNFHEDELVDIWAIHYYGKSPWALLKPKGVLDFLRKISKPIWITETGDQNPKKHLDYLQNEVAFLVEKCANIQQVFWYQYDEEGDQLKYGLRNISGQLSPLYHYFRIKNGK